MWKQDYRIRFTTSDGCLVLNRGTDKRHWKSPWSDRWHDEKYIRELLETDCREKGVRLISFVMKEDCIDGVVEWLSNKRKKA